ncbi:hypothetical protein CDL15_Pgr014160 [Punica granatum]|uniref:Uncharacterized protein n=1 Tax=Punica granatum TaxID=22663 RepID=A0A218XIJ0_PUNGR|nr:hypothetical protein CDL15_Pgr014160 [Punica granatum]PKI55418.1 hypothetical protein CRG98_024191 [Punica granatum]
MDVQRHGHAQDRTQQVGDVSTDVWMSRKCERAWACMDTSQKDVGARLVGTGTRRWRARQARGACAGAGERARLVLGWHYSPESDDFARNALNDLKQ